MTNPVNTANPIEQVLEALHRANVRYMVVGGVAVVLHGHLRATADLDLVIQMKTENIMRAVQALQVLGWKPRAPVDAEALANPRIRRTWVDEKGMTVFSMWNPSVQTLEVDIFVEEPFDFDEVYERSIPVKLDVTQARVIGLDDLIFLKRQAGRLQDLADIEALHDLVDGNDHE